MKAVPRAAGLVCPLPFEGWCHLVFFSHSFVNEKQLLEIESQIRD
jgi:hypothetical protein